MRSKLRSNASFRVRRHRQRTLPRDVSALVELLEDRSLLATISWDGGASSLLWNDAANWDTNTLPVATDDVFIDIAGTNTVTSTGTVSIRNLYSNETVSVTGGSFSFAQNNGPGAVSVQNNSGLITTENLSNAGNVSIVSGSTLGVGATPTNGLVSLWHAEGNASDSADGNSGTLLGNTTFGTGRVGQTFVFDGVQEAVSVGNPSNLRLQTFTIEAWVRRSSAAQSSIEGSDAELFGYGSGGYGLGMFANGQLFLSRIGFNHVTSSAAVTDTNFHHVAVTKSGSTVVFYVDGTATTAAAYDPGFTFTTNAGIGARTDGFGNTFYGAIDEIAVFDRALSQAEVQAAMNGGAYTQTAGMTTVAGTLTAGAINIQAGSAVFGTNSLANVVSFYNGEGNANDGVGGNNGTLQNGAMIATGKIGQGFSLDGNDDWISANQTFANDQSFTAAAWVFWNGHNGQTHQEIFSWWNGTDPVANRMFLGTSQASGQGPIRFGDGWNNVPVSLPTGRWVHVAASYDGTTNDRKVFLDGVQVASLTASVEARFSGLLAIGRQGNAETAGEYWNGLIDEATILSRALSANEIADLAAATSSTVSGSTLIIPAGKIVGTVNVTGSGSLNGSGIVAGKLTNNATVSPGNSPGIITVDGNYEQGSTGTLNIELGGTTAGTQYDQLDVNGTVTLAGSLNRSLINGFNPAVGNTFTIIDNDGTDAVSGTFSGLIQGATFTLGYATVQISYAGGSDNNDVVLTVTASPVIWDGGPTGTGTVWSLAENWVGDVLPGTADDVVIPDLTGTPTITSSGTVSIKSLTSAEKIELTGGSLSVLQPTALNGGLTQNGGVFYSGTSFSNTSTVNVASGSTLVAGGISGGVSIWHGEGNANDGFGNNTGTLTNGATTTTSGQLGSAFELDGVDDFVNVPNHSTLDPTAAATLQAWVYLDVLPSTAGHVMTVVAKSGNGTDLDLQVETDNKVHFYVATGAPNKVISTTTLQTGQWYHLAATYKANDRVEMYVNGVLEATTLIPGVTRGTNSNPLTIGASAQWAGRYFDGRIDEPALYNRALSATEIASVMNGGSYTQTAGTTTVAGTLTAASTNIQAGSVTLGAEAISHVVSLYKGEGNANDSADGNNGSFQNGATTTTSGKIGSAFSFDGVNDFVEIPDSTNLSVTGQLSLSAWVNPVTLTPASGSDAQVILAKYNTTIDQPSYVYEILPDGRVLAAVFASEPVYRSVTTNASVVGAGVFTHVAATFNPSNQALKIFVNGAEVPVTLDPGSGTVASILDSTATLRIGALTGVNGGGNEKNYFNGRIDEAAIFDRALSASEIANIASATSSTVTGSTLFVPDSKVIGAVNLSSSGTLNGIGTVVGNVSNAGIVAPGNSPGVITVNGNYSQTSVGDLNIEIGGTTVGTEYDRLTVNGTVTLGGDLIVTAYNSFVPTAGNTFTILTNDGTDAISGAFVNLAEGATITNFLGSGLTATITYVANADGGSVGNDVALTVLATPTLSAVLDGSNNLTITDTDGTGKHNSLTVTVSGSDLVVTDASESFTSAPAGGALSNGNKTLTIPLSAFNSLTINAAGGTDDLDLNSSLSRTGSHTLSFTAETIDVGAATLSTADGNQTYTGSLGLSGSTLSTTGSGSVVLAGNVSVIGNSASSISGKLDLNGATRTFTVADGAANPDLSISAVISGTGAGLTKSGTGTLDLIGANTYTGGTTLNAGVVVALHNSALGTGTITFASDSTLRSGNPSGSTTRVLANNIAVSAGVTATVDATAAFPLVLNGNITSAATSSVIDKIGAEGLGLGGDNSGFTGTFRLRRNHLLFNSATAGSENAAWVVQESGVLIASTVNGATIKLGSLTGSSSADLRNDGFVSGNATFEIGALNTSTTFDGIIRDNAGSKTHITKKGTGTLSLGAMNTYTGDTLIQGGTLKLGAAGAISDYSDVIMSSGTTLDLNGFNETFDAIHGVGGTVTSSAAGAVTLTVGFSSDTAPNFQGVIQNGSGTVSLTKIGTGNQTLSGINTYTGATTANNGTLTVTGNPDFINTGNLSMNSPGVLQTRLANQVSLWSGEGNANDSVGATNGTFMGGATTATGRVGQAFEFDGVDDAVRFGDVLESTFVGDNKKFSVSFWTKLDSLRSLLFVGKVGDSVAGPENQRQFYVSMLPDGAVDFLWYGALNGSSYRGVETTTKLTTGAWYHIAVTYDGAIDTNNGLDRATIYFNGVAQAKSLAYVNGSLGDIQDGTANLAIGAEVATNLNAAGFLDGQIDEVAIYDRLLSGTEVASLASADSVTQTAGTTSLGTGGVLHGGIEVNGGSLVGTGTVRGDVENAAIVAPGNSPGIITVDGNYSQASAGDLNIEIGGTTVGTQYDQLDVNGTVTLGGDLVVSLINSFTPAVGNTFTIIDNDGIDAVSGTFNGLAQGGTFTAGSTIFTISYGAFEVQVFDSAAAAATSGWQASAATDNGNNYGFSNTNNTGGSSPAGEAGGTIARTTNLSYYADTSVGALSLNTAISASGELDFNSPANFNNNIRIGHFDSTDATGQFSSLGLVIVEPSGANFRVVPYIILNDNTELLAVAPFTLTTDGDYSWRYDWNPTSNTLTVEIFNNADVSMGTQALTLTAGQRAVGVTLNAFGLSSGGLGNASSTNTINLFIDKVTYTSAVGGTDNDVVLTKTAGIVTWDGDGDGTNWSDANNWDGNVLPTASDDVVITGSGTVVSNGTAEAKSLVSSRLLNITGGSLTLSQASALNGGLDLAGGTLTANGNVTLAGTSTWSGSGTLAGTGIVTNAGTLTLQSLSSGATLSGSLNNTGTINHNSSTSLTASGTINNQGLFDIRSGGGLYEPGAPNVNTSVFNNTGTLRKSTSTADILIRATINNSGLVEAQAGTLTMNGKFGTHTGSFTVASGATLFFNGNFGPTELLASSSITGTGDVRFATQHGANVRGTYNITGAGTTFAGSGTVTFHSTITSVGVTLMAIGGTADFGSNSFSVPTLYMESGGAIYGTGTITTDNAWWNGATMGSAGTTVVNTSLGFGNSINQGGLTGGRTLRIGAGATVGNSDVVWAVQGGSIIDNYGTWNREISDSVSNGTFNNYGVYQTSGQAHGNHLMPIHFVNSGIVQIRGAGATGRMTINGTPTTGFVQTAAGNLNLEIGGTYVGNNNPETAPAFDWLKVNGTVALAGNLNLSFLPFVNPFAPSVGNSFTIIQNDGIDAVVGTFAGLPQGTSLSVAGATMQISYIGGDGNDVVLTTVPSTPVISGTAGADALRIYKDGSGNVIVELNATPVYSAQFGNLGSLTINGGDGNDTVTIDYSAAGGFFNLPITYNGGNQTGAPGDTLVINDAPGTAGTITHTFSNANDGTVNIDGTLITYTGLEPITDNLSATDRVFTFSSGNDAITLADATGAAMTIDSNLAESVTFANPTNSLTINAGDGTDSVAINSVDQDGAFRAAFSINGDGGTDTITLATNLSLGNGTVTGNLSLNGETINLNATTIATDLGTNGGNVTLAGAVVLGANVSLDTDGSGADGGVTVTGSINADSTTNNRTLQLTAGGGTLNLSGSPIGASEGLQSVTASSTVQSLFNSIRVRDGGISITAGGSPAVILSGDLRTDAGPGAGGITITGSVDLDANVTIDSNDATGADGNISITGSVNAKLVGDNRTLTLDAGDGTISFGGNIGGSRALQTLTVSSASSTTFNNITTRTGGLSVTATTINLNGNVNTDALTSSGSASFTGAVVLGANVSIDTDNSGTDGSLSFSSTINADNAGTQNRLLTINTGSGSVTFGGAIGSSHALADLDVTAATINLNANVTADDQGGNTLTWAGAVVLGANVVFDVNGTADNSVTFSGTINADDSNTANRTFVVDADTGTVTFGGSIGAGTNGALADFDVTATTITLNGATIQVDDQAASAQTVNFNGAVVLGAGVTIDTDAASGNDNSVRFTRLSDAISGANSLTVSAGGGSAQFDGAIGSPTRLTDFDVTAATIRLPNDVLTDGGSLTFVGNVILNFAGQLTIDTESGDNSNAGSVTFSGGSISGGAANRDLVINTTTGGTNTSGNISLSTVDSNGGFALRNLTLNASRATTPGTGALADVTLASTITLASNGNLDIDGQTVTLSTSSSDVSVSGTGTINIDASRNVVVSSGASLTTVNGNLTVSANQQTTATSGNFVGVDLNNGLIQATGTGAVTVKGTGGNDSAGSQIGVRVQAGGDIIGGTSGLLTVTGTGGASTGSSNYGVQVQGTGSTITSGGGSVSVTGTGGGSGTSDANFGVFVFSAGQITTGGSGSVTVTGTGGASTGGSNYGVLVQDTGSTITSGGGSVSVTGTGGSGANGSHLGVLVYLAGQITAGGSGSVTVTGTGGASTGGSNSGVSVQDTGSKITSGGGSVSVTGTGGGSGTSFSNFGVLVFVGQITAGGSGSVTVTGTGGVSTGINNNGVKVQDTGSTITSSGGSVSVTGIEGGGPSGTAINVVTSGSITTAANGGTLTLVGNSMNFDSTAVISAQSGSSVTLRQRSNSTQINLGAADSAGVLGLTDAELDRVTAGTINIGNANSGTITVSDAISRTAATNLSLVTGGSINFTGSSTLLDANGGNVTLNASSGAITSGGGSKDIRANGVTLTGGASGIGSNINPFITEATSLTANVGGNGPSYLSEIDTVNVVSLSNHTGSVNLMSGTFRIAPSGGVNGFSPVFIDSAAVLQLNGNELYLNSLSGSGAITNDSATAGTLHVYNQTASTFSGVLGGSGTNDNNFSLTTENIGQGAGGTFTLTGANTYTGTTTVNYRTLAINSSVTSNVVVGASGTLNGSGTITGNVSGTGTFSPGNSPGVMTINGNFTPSGTVNFEVNDAWTTAGTDFDQYVVNGGVDLTGVTITFSNTNDAAAPTANSLIKLINNDGTGDATTIANTPAQGAVVTIGSRSFKLFYNGGDGNDVVIVENSTPTVVYVDDSFTQTDGTLIADADLGTTGSQAAVKGITAFASINAALAAVSSSGTIIVNGGTYSEAVSLTGTRTLEITGPNSAQTVIIDDLTTIAGTPVVIEGTSNLTVGDADDRTLAGVISGSGSFTKQGAGTYTLTAANTFTGQTTIAVGTLKLGNNSALGSETDPGKTVVQSGATLDIAGFRAGANANELVEVTGSGVGGNGAIVNSGGGSYAFRRLTMTGDTTIRTVGGLYFDDNLGGSWTLDMGGFSLTKIGTEWLQLRYNTTIANEGDVLVNQGTFVLEHGTVFDGPTRTISVASGTTLYFANNSSQTHNVQLALAHNSTVLVQSSSTTVTGQVSLTGTPSIYTDSNLTLSGKVTGTGNLSKSGPATLTLSNNSNDYTGATNINAGVLKLSGSVTIPTVPSGAAGIYTFDSGTVSGNTVTNLGSTGTADNGNLVSAATVVGGGIRGNAMSTTGGTNAHLELGTAPGISLAGGVWTASAWFNGIYSNGNYRTLFRSAVDDHQIIIEAGSDNLGFYDNATSGGFRDSGYDLPTSLTGWHQVAAVGSGTTTTFFVDGVQVGISDRNSTSDIFLVGGYFSQRFAALIDEVYIYQTALSSAQVLELYQYGTGFATASSNLIPDSSTVTISGTGTLDLNGLSETVGAVVGSGTVTNGFAATTPTLTTGGNNSSTTFSGVIQDGAGTVALTKTGAGTLTLSGANTFSGNTSISAGTLAVGASHVIPDGAGKGDVSVTGTLAFVGDFSETINGLSGAGTIDKTSGTGTTTLTVGNNDSIGTFAGVIQNSTGTLGLTKVGSSTQTLSGANTYAGDTTISGGTLAIGANNVIPDGTGKGDVTVNGTLAFAGDFSDTINGLSGNGSVNKTAGTGTSTLTIGSDHDTSTFSGAIQNSSGTLALTKVGTGTTTLSGINTYTGQTTVNVGGLTLSGGSAIADTAAVVLANTSGGVLTLSSSEAIGSLSGGGTTGGNVALGANTLATGNASSTTFAGVIGGTGSLVKFGTGTFTLTGTNTYSGNTTINAGTLAIGASNVLPDGAGYGDVTVHGTLAFAGDFSETINGLSGLGFVNKTSGTGLSTLTVGNDNDTSAFDGTIQNTTGTVGLTKVGTGTLTLSSENTYSGATNINAGVLKLSAPATPAILSSAVGLYTFDSGTVSGSTVTNLGSSGTTDNGNLMDGAAVVAGGILGNAMSTTGSSTAHLQLGTAPGISLAGGSWTASAWFNGIYSNGNYRTLFRSAVDDHQIIIQAGSDNLGFFDNATSGGFRDSGYDLPTSLTGWHQVTAVGSGTTTTFFVDGVQVGVSDRNSTSDIFFVGSYANQRFAQLIDEVYIYQISLSAARVLQLYQYGAGIHPFQGL